jgi:Ni,Fe-hydrogenase I large subunit
MNKKITINPFNRVEGDLKVAVEIQDNTVSDAHVAGVMFRGFEKILKNHFPEDALVYTPRICGICSVSHSVAAAAALAAVAEPFVPSGSGTIARNIVHATENTMSHITQFYLYFAPDMLNSRYAELDIFGSMKRRFAPLSGSSVVRIVSERKRFLEILGHMVGKWPHTLAIHPGGITLSLDASQIFRIKGILAEFASVVESVLIGMPLAEHLSLRTEEEMNAAYGSAKGLESDLGLFLRFAQVSGLGDMGRGPGRFLSAGAYRQTDGSFLIPPGYWDGDLAPLDPGEITESIAHSFFTASAETNNPFSDVSEAKWDKPGAYSWAKAPRYSGRVVEVGALGRQVISGDPLIRDLYARYGSTVLTRVLARLREAVILLQAMNSWAGMLDQYGNYFAGYTIPQEGSGIGMTEAARGFLGHWIEVDKGRIRNYQVITPTAWNCSPRDESGCPGAVEGTLIGSRIGDPGNPVEISHIIRSFDPCLVCTVH